MKEFLLIMFCAGILPVTAQTTGTLHFEEKVKLEIKLDGADEKMMADMPKERIVKRVLYFTPDASLYRNDEDKEAPQDIDKESDDGGRVVIKMQVPDDKIFQDLKGGKLVEQRDFMSRKFLIESDLAAMKWKMTGNQKMIIGYPCQEAELQDSARKVTVWFTSAIPLSSGPNGYSNLPGMILAANIDNGKRIIEATGADLKSFDESVLVKPKEGKKVTREEFNKIVAEKRKEMEAENGGGGNVIIKIRN